MRGWGWAGSGIRASHPARVPSPACLPCGTHMTSEQVPGSEGAHSCRTQGPGPREGVIGPAPAPHNFGVLSMASVSVNGAAWELSRDVNMKYNWCN